MSRKWDSLSITDQKQTISEVNRMKARPDWPGWREAAHRFDLGAYELRERCEPDFRAQRRAIAKQHRERTKPAPKAASRRDMMLAGKFRRPAVDNTAAVLRYMQARANGEGDIHGATLRIIAGALNIKRDSVLRALNLLVKRAGLSRTDPGRSRTPVYRITAASIPAAVTLPPTFESVIRYMPNRNFCGCSDALPTIAISLPRVRFLEDRAHG